VPGTNRHIWMCEIAAGTGLGMLVGILVGLSATGVVGGVIGSLAALLAAFLGLTKSSIGDGDGVAASRTLRIASFGFACTVGVILGVGARAHNWLGEPIQTQAAHWRDAGASREDAVAYVVYQQLGVVPVGRTVGVPPNSTPISSVLMANHDPSECASLSETRFSNAQNRLNAMQNVGGSWGKFADVAKSIPIERLDGMLNAGYQLVCGDKQ
jgi:hypothetical protein